MRKRIAVVAMAVILVTALGWGAWWWTHPRLLDGTSPLGDSYFEPRPLPEATIRATVAVGPESDETITLRNVKARFKVNTAKATATFTICRRKAGASLIGSIDDEPLDKWCSALIRVKDGTRFHFSSHDHTTEYILMTVVPKVPGTADVDQIAFTYSRSARHLWQRGTETSAQRWVLHATS